IYINDFDHIKLIENAQLQVEDIISNKEPLSIKDLKINGNDLKELGIKDGRIIGSILNFLLENVLRNPEINTKNHLLKLSNQYINKSPVS
ncbi:polynucleotide adenylyltransferase, partial [Clostridium cadaveris]|nr:polynucleotide adenylyltransferase [Clostridium cadaveris]